MISVNVKFIDNKIKEIVVSGHAFFDEFGKDIVCAGVSSIIIGGINSIEKYIKDVKLIQESNKLGIQVINDNTFLNERLETIYVQLKTIEESYPKNIKINGGI